MTKTCPDITVYHFAPAWGLPTSGPFALKLLAWLSLHELPWKSVVQNDPRKGPVGKSPWASIDDEVVGDSDRIIERLSRDLDIHDAEADLAPADRGIAQAFKTAYEERVHQILETDLFVDPAGLAFLRGAMADDMPRLLVGAALPLMKRQFTRQLYARGILRHSPDEVQAMARREFEALAGLLSTRPFICGDRPGLADLACFGQLAPMLRWDMKTPAANQAKQMPNLVRWCAAVESRCFESQALPA